MAVIEVSRNDRAIAFWLRISSRLAI